MRMRTAPFSSETRYVSPHVARSPSSFREGVRIYFNIMLGVLLIYFLWYYLLPLL